MEKRLSYITVGAFVLIIGFSTMAFLFWLAKYGNKSVEYDYYKTYFTESVSGLNIESLVKLRGVEVGRVRKISINKENSEEVEILLEIIQDTPIKEDSYTMLDTQGITGLKYIELKGGTKESARLKTSKDNISVIESKKSLLSNLYDSSESITNKVDKILDKVAVLLSPENIENISKITQNLNVTTKYIDDNKQKFGSFLDTAHESLGMVTSDVSRFVEESKVFLEHTKRFEDELLPSFAKLGSMSDRAGAASDTTKEFFSGMTKELKNGQMSFADIVEENLEVLNQTALSLRDLTIKLNQTVEKLEQSPSDILFKSREDILGPGESNE